MNTELLAPHKTVEEAATLLITEAEAYLAAVRKHRLLRSLGRTMLDGLVLYGAALSGCATPPRA